MTERVGVAEFALAADLTGTTWCREAGCDGKKSDPGVVHMDRVRFTRTGLHRFLMAAYDARWGHDKSVQQRERWIRRYDRAHWVLGIAADMNRTLPAKCWELERARMREELAEYTARVPAFARPIEKYRAARRWSSRT